MSMTMGLQTDIYPHKMEDAQFFLFTKSPLTYYSSILAGHNNNRPIEMPALPCKMGILANKIRVGFFLLKYCRNEGDAMQMSFVKPHKHKITFP